MTEAFILYYSNIVTIFVIITYPIRPWQMKGDEEACIILKFDYRIVIVVLQKEKIKKIERKMTKIDCETRQRIVI